MMYEFCSKLYAELEAQLDALNVAGSISGVEMLRDRLFLVKNALSKLEVYILEKGFSSDQDEIAFFKDIYPQFYSWYIYFNEFFSLQRSVPSGPDNLISDYYLAELIAIDRHQRRNSYVYEYSRCGDVVKDEEYFLRRNYDPLVSVPSTVHNTFFTNQGYTFACFIAHSRISIFISGRLNALYKQSLNGIRSAFTDNKLIWTGEKTDLVELANALKNLRCINNGNIDVAIIIQVWEEVFGLDLSGHYRIWSDIACRKISSPTKFLDSLVEANRSALTERNRFKPKKFSGK